MFKYSLYKGKFLTTAYIAVLVHTHPSGCINPSPEDFLITKRIKSAGESLGIPLTDHLIIGNTDYFSFAEHGELR